MGSAPIEVVEGGRHEGGETGGQADAGNGDFPAPLGEEGCVVASRVPEPLSKRERRRRRRDIARMEFERRRGLIPKAPDVSVGEKLDSVQGLLPNSVAFLRKHMPRSP